VFDSFQNSWSDRLRSKLRSKGVWRLVAAWVTYAAIPASLILIVRVIVRDENLVPLILLWPILFCVLVWLGVYLRQTWKRSNLLNAQAALAADGRPPILYLRPFKADKVTFASAMIRRNRARAIRKARYPHFIMSLVATFAADWIARVLPGGERGEELIVEPLQHLGPVIAIGRPGERVPPMGAARVYVGNEWRDVVHSHLQNAQLVLLFAGTTPNFTWEITKVFRNEPFVPILLMLPFFENYSKQKLVRFVTMFNAASGLTLPDDLSPYHAAYFSSPTEMMLIEEYGVDEMDLNYINPFLGSIVRVAELTRPRFRDFYLYQARAESLDRDSFSDLSPTLKLGKTVGKVLRLDENTIEDYGLFNTQGEGAERTSQSPNTGGK
jgi:hypothetical protein